MRAPQLTICLLLLGMLAAGVLLPVPAQAQAVFPQNWPWRGVVVSSGSPPAEDLGTIRQELGINFVSLQIKPRLRALRDKVDPQTALEREFAWADGMLDACRPLGLVAMLVCYDIPIDPALGFDQKSPRFWDDPDQVEDMVQLSARIADHFKVRGLELAGYQIQSEPVVLRDGKFSLPQVWPDALERIIRAIRGKDPGRWIAVSLTTGGSPDYRNARPLHHPGIVYNAHMYLPHAYTHQGLEGFPDRPVYPGRIHMQDWNRGTVEQTLKSLADFGSTYDVPVWIGEFSAIRWAAGAEDYLRDVAAAFHHAGFGWSYFALGGFHGWNPDYGTGYSRTNDTPTWSAQREGMDSVRWATLREIFRAGRGPAR